MSAAYLIVKAAMGKAMPAGSRAPQIQQILAYGDGPVHLGLTRRSFPENHQSTPSIAAFERTVFVEAGFLDIAMSGSDIRLPPGGYLLIPTGTFCTFKAVEQSATWLEATTPQARDRNSWSDLHQDSAIRCGGNRLQSGDIALKGAGVFNGSMPPVSDFHPDLQQAAQRMLIDREAGAAHLNMFVVEFSGKGLCNFHDHPFEEAYAILEGSVEARFGEERHMLHPGDIAWCGVGTRHSFNATAGRVRWLEFQTPQPPVREGMRWHSRWEKLLPRL